MCKHIRLLTMLSSEQANMYGQMNDLGEIDVLFLDASAGNDDHLKSQRCPCYD